MLDDNTGWLWSSPDFRRGARPAVVTIDNRQMEEGETMRLDWRVLGGAMAATLSIGYILCVAYDLVLGAQMYRAWVDLLPGFHWISWTSFGLGLLETIGYGVFFGLVFAPLYNFFLVKVWKHEEPRPATGGRA